MVRRLRVIIMRFARAAVMIVRLSVDNFTACSPRIQDDPAACGLLDLVSSLIGLNNTKKGIIQFLSAIF